MTTEVLFECNIYNIPPEDRNLFIESENRIVTIAQEGVLMPSILYGEGVYDEFYYEGNFTSRAIVLDIPFEDRILDVGEC